MGLKKGFIFLKVHSCFHDLCLTQKSGMYFYQTFQLMLAVVRLKGLVKVPLFCVIQKSRKYCLKNEWTLEDDLKRFLINPCLIINRIYMVVINLKN